MELIIYDTQNSGAMNDVKRTVHIDAKNGTFYFTSATVNSCGLKKGDRIILASDKDNKAWFFAKTDSSTGFILYADKDHYSALKIYSTTMARKISPSQRYSCFLISKDPQVINGVEYYSIITSRPVQGCRKSKKTASF